MAFIGDTVFDLLVREELIRDANRPVKDLHTLASKKVCAAAQAKAIKSIMQDLTPQETDIFKRGRNAHPGSTPKNQSGADYHYATGLECLFGWLYLNGNMQRIKELYEKISEKQEVNDGNAEIK